LLYHLERRRRTSSTMPVPMRTRPPRIQRHEGLRSAVPLADMGTSAGMGVQVRAETGEAGRAVPVTGEIGAAVRGGEAARSVGPAVGLSTANTDVGEPGSGEGVVSPPVCGGGVGSEGSMAAPVTVAVGVPSTDCPVGVGDGEDGAEGTGVAEASDGGRVGSNVGGMNGGAGVVGVGMVGPWAWIGASPAAPRASSRMTSTPRRAKSNTFLSTSFSFTDLPPSRGTESQTRDPCAGPCPRPADPPAQQPRVPHPVAA
jgi:hypothetical protein